MRRGARWKWEHLAFLTRPEARNERVVWLCELEYPERALRRRWSGGAHALSRQYRPRFGLLSTGSRPPPSPVPSSRPRRPIRQMQCRRPSASSASAFAPRFSSASMTETCFRHGCAAEAGCERRCRGCRRPYGIASGVMGRRGRELGTGEGGGREPVRKKPRTWVDIDADRSGWPA